MNWKSFKKTASLKRQESVEYEKVKDEHYSLTLQQMNELLTF